MQLLRFLAVGVANTVLGLACIFIAMRWLALDYRLANAAGYLAGSTLSYALNRSWTFRDNAPWHRSLPRWIAVIGICWGLNILAVIVLHARFRISPYASQLGGVAVYTAATFIGGRFIAFRAPAPALPVP